jgi:hypothetical protein
LQPVTTLAWLTPRLPGPPQPINSSSSPATRSISCRSVSRCCRRPRLPRKEAPPERFLHCPCAQRFTCVSRPRGRPSMPPSHFVTGGLMPAVRMPMHRARENLRMKSGAGLAVREIARRTDLPRRTVRTLFARFENRFALFGPAPGYVLSRWPSYNRGQYASRAKRRRAAPRATPAISAAQNYNFSYRAA